MYIDSNFLLEILWGKLSLLFNLSKIFTFNLNHFNQVETIDRCIGVIHKPRSHIWGEGVSQKTSTLNNSYLVKVATLGGGGQNSEKTGYLICVWPLT